MIIEHSTLIVNSSNINYLKSKGYKNIKKNDIINVKTKDLSKGSNQKISGYCDICGAKKEMQFRTYYKLTNNFTNKYYCHSCSFIKSEQTNLKKYGYKQPMKNISIMKKMIETNLKKYGVEHSSQLEKYKQKQENTNLKRYGVKCPLQNKTVKDKAIQTILKIYKFDHQNKSEIIKKKIKKTKQIRYNDENYNNRNKSEITCMKRYGVKNVIISNETKLKAQKTNSLKLKNKYKDIINVDYLNKTLTIKCEENHNFDIDISLFKNRKRIYTTLCTICNPIGSYSASGYEIQLQNFMKKNYKQEILTSDRKILNNKELDIYLPELKLAFEFNGLYWHNEEHKENNYHLNKTELCEKKGIQLIHIWEDNWINKQDIVKSMILNKLGKTPNKIYGRKTIIKEITDNKIVRNFLETNHLQGFIGSKIKLGLFFENELVSLMIFGKRRIAMGKKLTNEGEYELLRYCNKLNTNVLGGASKLFKYFIENFNPKEITTYADRSHSNGKLYKQLGFKFISKTQPNYFYIINGIRHHRFNFRKDKLIKEGFDPNKTEHQIMLDRNIYKIYDSGNLKYFYAEPD